MQFRVRLSVLEPPGVNATSLPATASWPGTVVSRTDELVDVRVTTEPSGRAGEIAYTVSTPSGGFLEGGVARAAGFATYTRMRRIVLVIEANADAAPRLLSAAAVVGRALETGGRTFVGENVRAIPARAGSGLGVFLGLLGLLGVGYYITKD